VHSLATLDPGEPRFCARCAHPLEHRADGGRDRPRCPECGWTYYAKSALGAAVMVEEDGRILLVQRAHDPYRNWWMLPAGFVEYGEDAAETAAREALEETGLLVVLEGYQGLYFGGGDPRGISHLAVFLARRVGGELCAADDACDARWFSRAEIPDNIAFEGHRKAISCWLAGSANSSRAPALLLYAGSGPAPPVLVYTVIENPSGSRERIRYDAELQDFAPAGEVFAEPLPVHYGWVPRTLSRGDGRELDVLVAGEGITAIGSVLAVRPIGALLREDGDHKVLAVRADMPSAYVAVTDASEVPELKELIDGLFRPRAKLTGWASASEARTMIMEAQAAWIARHRTDW
jgi:ADP-ribose pyrophosphatase YjhB (NUDIX family)/inorganic pyrophosphatase